MMPVKNMKTTSHIDDQQTAGRCAPTVSLVAVAAAVNSWVFVAKPAGHHGQVAVCNIQGGHRERRFQVKSHLQSGGARFA